MTILDYHPWQGQFSRDFAKRNSGQRVEDGLSLLWAKDAGNPLEVQEASQKRFPQMP